MYEFGLPEEEHLAIPIDADLESLFVLTIGILADCAAKINDINRIQSFNVENNLLFAASFFDAFLESRLNQNISRDVAFMASAAYYLSGRAGSSLVIAKLLETPCNSPVEELLRWLLQSDWSQYITSNHHLYGNNLGKISKKLAFHFSNGSNIEELINLLNKIRKQSYAEGTDRDLLFIDLIMAIVLMKISSSSWLRLPNFTNIGVDNWKPIIQGHVFQRNYGHHKLK